MKTKLVYWDNELYIKIPKDFLNQLEWEKGDCVNVDLDFENMKLDVFKSDDKEDVLAKEADEDF